MKTQDETVTKKATKTQVETLPDTSSASGTAEASKATDAPNAIDAPNATVVTEGPNASDARSISADAPNAPSAPSTDAASTPNAATDAPNAIDAPNATVVTEGPNASDASSTSTDASNAPSAPSTDAATTQNAATAPNAATDAPNTSLDDALASTANDALRLAKKSAFPHVGLGVDVVDIARMERIMKRSPAFIQRVFSETERAYCTKNALASAHFAARFAAKEAVVKALGTGFSDGIAVRDVEIVHTAHGRPVVALHGRAQEIADECHICEIPVSLSFTHSHAVACAVCITEEARAARAKDEARPTSRQQLNEQFKQARRMLDDL